MTDAAGATTSAAAKLTEKELQAHSAVQESFHAVCASSSAVSSNDEQAGPVVDAKPKLVRQMTVQERQAITKADEVVLGQLYQSMETPVNFHQVVVFHCLSQGVSTSRRCWYFVGSLLLVAMQLGSLLAVAQSIAMPSCSTRNPSCPHGKWCFVVSRAGDASVDARGTCIECGSELETEMVMQLCTNSSNASDIYEWMSEDNILERCAVCFTSSGKFKNAERVDTEAAAMMRGTDWLVLLLSIPILTLSITSELRDILLCDLARAQHSEHEGTSCCHGWKCLLRLVNDLRTFAVIPNVVAMWPSLVIHRGSDAFNICMNTVAILFILDFDNVIYASGVSTKLKAAFERYHHVLLTAEDERKLERVKLGYYVLVPIYILTTLQLVIRVSRSLGMGSFLAALLNPIFPIAAATWQVIVTSSRKRMCCAWALAFLKIVGFYALAFFLVGLLAEF